MVTSRVTKPSVLAERYRLIDSAHVLPCTLDDVPACIYGAKCDFPTVAVLDGPLRLEFAWSTAQRIMDNGGDFRS